MQILNTIVIVIISIVLGYEFIRMMAVFYYKIKTFAKKMIDKYKKK